MVHVKRPKTIKYGRYEYISWVLLLLLAHFFGELFFIIFSGVSITNRTKIILLYFSFKTQMPPVGLYFLAIGISWDYLYLLYILFGTSAFLFIITPMHRQTGSSFIIRPQARAWHTNKRDIIKLDIFVHLRQRCIWSGTSKVYMVHLHQGRKLPDKSLAHHLCFRITVTSKPTPYVYVYPTCSILVIFPISMVSWWTPGCEFNNKERGKIPDSGNWA